MHKITITEIAFVDDDARVLFKFWNYNDERGWEYADQEMRMCTPDEVHGIQHVFGLEHEHEYEDEYEDEYELVGEPVGGTEYEEFAAVVKELAALEHETEDETKDETEDEAEITTTLGAITRQLRPRDDDGDVKDL